MFAEDDGPSSSDDELSIEILPSPPRSLQETSSVSASKQAIGESEDDTRSHTSSASCAKRVYIHRGQKLVRLHCYEFQAMSDILY